MSPKPKKPRNVLFPPNCVFYKPRGVPLSMLEQVVLTVGEYEAIRLVDQEGLDHEKASKKMKVSRPTCARIVESAHRKIAEALTEGKAIRIEGGNFMLEKNRFRCSDCGYIWEVKIDNKASDKEGDKKLVCKNCKGANILDLSQQIGWISPGTSPRCGRGKRGKGGGGMGFKMRYRK